MPEKRYKLNKAKLASVILSIVCVCLIAFIAINYNGKSMATDTKETVQSNKLDRNNEQIIILADRIDIKAMMDKNSKTIGKVYKNEIYTVLEANEDESWIHILTENGINGFIYAGDAKEDISFVTKGNKEIEVTPVVEEKTTEVVTTTNKVLETTTKNANNQTTTAKTTTTAATTKTTVKTYSIKATAPDSQSPARILTVYENGVKVSFKSINYSDGSTLCSSSTCNVNISELDEVNYQVILSDGTKVTARLS